MSLIKDVPQSELKDYIRTIQEIHNFKSISYRKIQKELRDLYNIDVDIERIEENYDNNIEVADMAQQFKNLGMK